MSDAGLPSTAEADGTVGRCGASPIEDLLHTAADNDPGTWRPSWQSIGDFLSRWDAHLNGGDAAVPLDLGLRAWLFLERALQEILFQPRRRHLHAATLVRADKLKEMDTRCVKWLLRRPGREATDRATPSGRVLGVTRPVSFDVEENRLVRALAARLYRLVESSRHAAPPPRGHKVNPKRMAELERALRTLRRFTDTDEEPFGPLRLSRAPRPNHALVGDRRYRKAWIAWQSLNRSTGESGLTATTLCQALLWSVGAELCRLGLLCGDGAARLSQESLAVSCGEDEGLRFLAREGEAALVIDLAATQDSLLVRVTHMQPSRRMLLPSGDRGAACSASFLLGTFQQRFNGWWNDDTGSDPCESEASLSGLRQSAAWVASRIVRSGAVVPAPVPLSRHKVQATAGSRHVGVDLVDCRMRISLRAADSDEADQTGALLIAAPVSCPGEARPLALVGDAAARRSLVRPGTPLTSLMPLWSCGAAGGRLLTQEQEQAGREIVSKTPYAPGMSLAFAIPDATGEYGRSLVRQWLPATHTHSWLVWRSVAAALAWRDGWSPEGVGVAAGDLVLVLEGDGESLDGSVLRVREVPETGQGCSDWWEWERMPLPTAVSAGAPGGRLRLYQVVAQALVEEVLGEEAIRAHCRTCDCAFPAGAEEASMRSKRLARRIADLGLVDQALGGEGDDNIWLPFGCGDRICLVADVARERVVELFRRAAEDESGRYGDWIGSVAEAREIGNPGEGRQLHVLLAGGHLSSPEVRENVATAITSVLPVARLHVMALPKHAFSRGARIFLERRERHLPTWSEILPSLCLEVDGARRITLFDGRRVVPGDDLSSRPPGIFELSAGYKTFEFPLLRMEEGRQEEKSEIAVIRLSEVLAEAVRVTLRVAFRYASDTFRVEVVPEGKAPFDSREISWRPGVGSEVLSGIKPENIKPEFPERSPWPTLTDVEFVRLGRLARDFGACADGLLRNLKHELSLATKAQNKDRKQLELADRVVRLNTAMLELRPEVNLLWSRDRETGPLPEKVDVLLKNQLLPALETVLALGKPRFEENWQRLKRLGHGDILKNAVNLAAALKWSAPPNLASQLVQGARMTGTGFRESNVFHAVGRMVGIREADSATAAVLLHGFDPDSRQHSDICDHLWAFTTILWTHESFADALPREAAEELLDKCLRTLRRLSGDLADEPIAKEIINEACATVLGLLRLRGGGKDDLVHVGSGRTEAGARIIEEALRGMAEQGNVPAAPRLRLAQGESPLKGTAAQQVLPEATVQYLRGERRARILWLEDGA